MSESDLNTEADAAALRRIFNRAIETYPQKLAQFLSKEAEAAFRAWWGQFYDAVRDTSAGLKLLAELADLRAAAPAPVVRPALEEIFPLIPASTRPAPRPSEEK